MFNIFKRKNQEIIQMRNDVSLQLSSENESD